MQAGDADTIIAALGLRPHPEGGHYRETYRDPRLVEGRAFSTAIYYLLKAGEASRWHRIDAAEIWHWYGGDALSLMIAVGSESHEIVLGSKIEADQRPQAVVPAGAWQSARSLGAYSLVGCTVAPGFRFESFELAPPDFLASGE